MIPITPQRPTPTPVRPASRPGAPAQGARPAPAAARPAMIEADVRLRLDAEGEAGANGTVRLDSGFVTRLVRHLLRNPARFRAIDVRFDPATGSYAATGQVRIKGFWLPVAGRAKPVADGGQPAFRFEDLAVCWGPGGRWRFGPRWLTRKVTEIVAAEMTRSGVGADPVPGRGVVRVEPNSLLRKVRALPRWASLDATATRFDVRTGRNGDVHVTLTSEAQGPALRNTPRSDISVAADDAAIQAMLFRALAPSYIVRGVRLKSSGATVDGETEYKPLSDVATGLRLLGLLLSGGRGNATPAKVMGPLDLEVGVSGTVLDIKPSIRKALPELVKALEKAGIPHTVTKTSVQADLGPWLEDKGLGAHGVRTGDGFIEAHLEVDIDGRVRNPALRAPAPDSLPA